jgi:hypothetical protein
MVLKFFQWCQDSSLATIAGSSWLAPLVEVIHLLGLTILVGAIVLVSLRLLGLLMTSRPVSEIAGDLWPWTVVGLMMQLASGAVLFASESVRWYWSDAFWVKMTFLLLAILFHFTIYHRVTRRDDLTPLVYRLTGAVALTLWFGVGVGGRALTTL